MPRQTAPTDRHPPAIPPGLSREEAERRLSEVGPNELPVTAGESWWHGFMRQFRSPLIYILLVALVVDTVAWLVAGAVGIPAESVAIALILVGNAGLGIWQERKAEEALSRLGSLTAPQVWVYRDEKLERLPSREVVPGDVVRVATGDRVPADGTLQSPDPVRLDESVLTGESVPIDKVAGDELMAGTLLVRGQAMVVVTRTGASSTMGRLAEMITTVPVELTPLGRRLQRFGHRVARWVLGLAAMLVLFGVWVEGVQRFPSVLLFAVALAVAAVPEGLPAVLTVTLALGVERMAKRRAVIRRLDAVETLGSVTVIATDKTGTITENRMEVRQIDSPHREACLRAMVLVNDAEPGSDHGDPTEIALLRFAEQTLDDVESIRRTRRISTLPFDPEWKYMRVSVAENGVSRSYFKGAPEVLLERALMDAAERRSWIEKIRAYASQGYRVLGFAMVEGEAEAGLTWLGLGMLWDPPRPEVPDAIRRAKSAGIRVLMITGDHPETAMGVANVVGISSELVVTGVEVERASSEQLGEMVQRANVFARVAPEHKLRIVGALKEAGEVVAVTGDGVNDAPALKRADIGIAMGLRGSDVSREAADLVLTDDNFATIVAAIEEGRNIYVNIQKFIRFLFSTNLSEILVVVIGMVAAFLLGLRDAGGALLLPLTAVQLLWINLVTDGAPALALGMDKNPGLLQRPPRDPAAPLLDRASVLFIIPTGIVKGMLALLLLWHLPRAGYSPEVTRTAAFVFLAAGQLLYAYPARHIDVSPLSNPWLHVAVFGGIAMQFAVIWVAPLRLMLDAVPLPWTVWWWVIGGMLAAWGFAELHTVWLRRRPELAYHRLRVS